MADVSGITAALPQTTQQNPLQTFSTIVGIQNDMQRNKLLQQGLLNSQQDLVNKQIEQQKGELGVTQSKLGMAAGMAWMLHTDPNLTYDRAMQGIDDAERLGYPRDQLEVVRGMLKPDMDQKSMSDIFGRVALQIVGPKTAQEMMSPSTSWRTSQQVDYPLITQPVGNMEGAPAGVPQQAWNDGQGIGAPGGIRQLAPPTWQTGVTQGGEEQSVPAPNLNSFGRPLSVNIPSTGAGASGGGAAASAAPSPDSTTTPSGFNRTKLAPETQAANQTSAGLFSSELQGIGTYAQRNQQNIAALTALRNASTGPGSPDRQWAKSFLYSVAPDVAQRLGINATDLQYYDEANKYLTARKAALSGSAASDYARAQTDLANPSVEISNAAAYHMHQINVGFDNMRQAAMQSYLAQHPGQSLTDPNVSAGFLQYQQNYYKTHDYRAYMPETKAERYKTIHSLSSPEDKQTYGASQKDAKSIGVTLQPDKEQQ